MAKFNTTTVMLLDEDIQIKQQNARALMVEDIENAVGAAEDNHITLDYPCYADSVGDDTCDGIELTDEGIEFSFEFGWRYIKELDYDQLHTIYEAMRMQGCFKDED